MHPGQHEFHRMVEELLIKLIINEDSEINRRLDRIEHKLNTLLLLHNDEAQLKAAADKLGIKTDALAEVLKEQQPKKDQ